MRRLSTSFLVTLIFVGYEPRSSCAFTVNPPRLVVAPIKLTTTSLLVRGWPFQLVEMAENRRCSILSHLEVPGGKWHTVMEIPVLLAKRASSVFHSRGR